MTTHYPIIVGKTGLDAVRSIAGGIDKRKTMKLAMEIQRETAMLNMTGLVLETLCLVVRGVNERETMRLDHEIRRERHIQTMQRAYALDQYGAAYYQDLTHQEKRKFHEVFLNTFETS